MSEIGCPQCGSPVRMPHDADVTRCAFCGSTLVLARGVLTHLLRERIGVTRDQAAAVLQAWLARQDYAAVSVKVVDELRFFPFLRVTREVDELVVPLAALPSPAVGLLAHAPTELLESDRAVEGVDQDELDAALSVALADPETRSLQLEERGYYAARFTIGDEIRTNCSAVVGAGRGAVYPDALPLRAERSVARLGWYLMGLAVVLVAEAIAIPGVWPALVAIVLTAGIFSWAMLSRGTARV